ncbi:MAG: dihydrodipicolinate synthase family protein [Burkholderiales bacterium]|nr:dihydrodipicolinate synthase family protein [Burkholderiales bacterium]
MARPFTIIAAAFTPFDAAGNLAVERIAPQVYSLVDDGVDGAFVCGTTGEGAALTTAERKRVAEAWVAAAPKGFKVIVHVGHAAVAEAAELAAHAQSIGAYAVAAVAPYFLKPRNGAEVVASLAPIAAAAPKLPFFHYHIPSVSGVTVPAADVAREALSTIPNFAGTKFTGNDLGDLGRVLDVIGEDRDLFFGLDDMLLPAVALGVRSAVGMTFNYTGKVARNLANAYDANDMVTARAQQKIIRDLLGAAAPHGLINGLKGLAPIVGVDCGPCRAPLTTLSAAEAAGLEQSLQLKRALQEPATPNAATSIKRVA